MADNPGVPAEAMSAFKRVTYILFFILIAYFASHFIVKGSILQELSDQDKTVVNLILSSDSTGVNGDSTKAFTDSARVYKALTYILDKNKPANSETREKILQEYRNLSAASMTASLSTIKIPVASFFWLNSDLKFLEVVFWAIFGVISSLLYFSSEAMRTGDFKMEEIPVYWAKIIYAPFIVLIIVLGFKILYAAGDVNIDESSPQLIIFSFILGFFSGRAIELLNKIKDVILPGKEKAEEVEGTVTLTGKVFIENDEIDLSKEKVNICVTSPVSGEKIETETNEEKTYYIKNLKPGTYNIQASLTVNNVSYSGLITDKILKKENPVEVENIELLSNTTAQDGNGGSGNAGSV